jgi:hypothetical protein
MSVMAPGVWLASGLDVILDLAEDSLGGITRPEQKVR